MPSVLFTHSFFYRLDPKQWEAKQPYPPLGTLLAAAVVRNQQYEVSLFDASLASSPEEIIPCLADTHPSCVVIYDDGFNYLTKMCLTVMREAAFTMSGLAKKLGSTVIICSSDATDHYEKYFLNGVDYVIRGEGEETLVELLSALEKKEPVDTIHGLAYLKNGVACCTAPRAVMQDLDVLPTPAWDLVDIGAYRRIWHAHHGYFSLNVATTRGCPYKCNWCAKPIYGNRYNSRSPKKVADEIELLLQQYGPDHIWMCDDIFGLKPGWIESFRDEVVSRKLKFRYKIQSRVDLLLQPETVKALFQSGAETVWVGAESGSQKILTAMDKGTTVQQIYEASRMLRQQGIQVAFFIQFGYPGEMKADIDETLKMVLDLMPDDIGISVSYPLPGTKFYENVKGQFSQKQNWKDSDDLDMMFQNTYRPAFYKILHRYIHCRYRMNRGVQHLRSLLKKPLGTLPQAKKILSVPYYFLPSVLYAWKLRKLSAHGR
jgi:anaerobic magnesium-protoporphyrin IX monomethyl ester cyclase